jgi:hypothetical protein
MRPFCCALFAFLIVGAAFSQDTYHAPAPQYESNYSPYTLPLSTPSSSLEGPPLQVGASNATQGLTAGASNSAAELQPATTLPAVDLFPIYYGVPAVTGFEPGMPEAWNESTSAAPLPSGFVDTGVAELITVQDLPERGYGVSVAQAASHAKSLAQHAVRVYTNADIDRLHEGN